MSSDSILFNELRSLEYFDPEPVLRHLRAVELEVVRSDLPPAVRHLRTNELKRLRENRAAAIFTHGLAQVVGSKVRLAPVEAADYDFVTTWQSEEAQHFCPVQLKEWVPEELNPNAELNNFLRSVAKSHPARTRTALAIHVNREIRLDLAAVAPGNLPFNGLWLFGANRPDQSIWTIWGDFLKAPRAYEFSYPFP